MDTKTVYEVSWFNTMRQEWDKTYISNFGNAKELAEDLLAETKGFWDQICVNKHITIEKKLFFVE